MKVPGCPLEVDQTDRNKRCWELSKGDRSSVALEEHYRVGALWLPPEGAC